jgi:hypothetical protein
VHVNYLKVVLITDSVFLSRSRSALIFLLAAYPVLTSSLLCFRVKGQWQHVLKNPLPGLSTSLCARYFPYP